MSGPDGRSRKSHDSGFVHAAVAQFDHRAVVAQGIAGAERDHGEAVASIRMAPNCPCCGFHLFYYSDITIIDSL